MSQNRLDMRPQKRKFALDSIREAHVAQALLQEIFRRLDLLSRAVEFVPHSISQLIQLMTSVYIMFTIEIAPSLIGIK